MEAPVITGMTHLLRAFGDDISLRRARALRRMLVLFTVFKVSAFVVVGALVWLALGQIASGALDLGGVSLRQDVVTAAFDALFILQIADFAAGTGAIGPLSWSRASRAFARTLTNIVAARDPQLAHELPILPASGGEDALMIGPLSHPMRALALNDAVYVIAALAGVAVTALGIFMTIISLRVPPSFQPPITLANWLIWLLLPFCLLILGVAGIIVALVTRRFARLERLPIMAQLGSGSVTFTRVGDDGSTQRLAWGDARGLARLAFTDELGRLHEVFALSGPHQDYLWEALFMGQGGTGTDDEASRAAAHHLTEEIVRRSGLPLLDLTATLATTMAASNTASSYPLAGFFARARRLAKRRGDAGLMRDIDQREARSGWLLGRLAARLGGGVRRLSPPQQAETLRLAGELLPYYPTPAQLAAGSGGWRFAGGYVLSQYAFQVLVVALAIGSWALVSFQPFS
jgi:hypothetical protein